MEDIQVSVICNTYNHENYIAEALESFIMQKTNFKYEVLVHDDASTDKTAEIVKKFEKDYPSIIKPIYQSENQYSKGIRVGILNSERAVGKYIAYCEGDDYWNDYYKLQKQVDYLENNLDYSACVHATLCIDSESKKIVSEIRPSIGNKDFYIEEIIKGGGGVFATNSIVHKRDLGNIRPDFYFRNKSSFSDYQLMILLALTGKIYYMDEYMSTYRCNVPGSWTSKNYSNIEQYSNHIRELNEVLDVVNKDTKYFYDEIIKKRKEWNDLSIINRKKREKEKELGLSK